MYNNLKSNTTRCLDCLTLFAAVTKARLLIAMIDAPGGVLPDSEEIICGEQMAKRKIECTIEEVSR